MSQKFCKKYFKVYQVFMCLIILNILKYVSWDICPKKTQSEKYTKSLPKSLCVKLTRYSETFLNYIKSLEQNVLILQFCID